LLGAGWQSSVVNGRYMETPPDRPTTVAENRAVFFVQAKRAAASSAIERLKAECIRRGLID
jgi:hypothetical protein